MKLIILLLVILLSVTLRYFIKLRPVHLYKRKNAEYSLEETKEDEVSDLLLLSETQDDSPEGRRLTCDYLIEAGNKGSIRSFINAGYIFLNELNDKRSALRCFTIAYNHYKDLRTKNDILVAINEVYGLPPPPPLEDENIVAVPITTPRIPRETRNELLEDARNYDIEGNIVIRAESQNVHEHFVRNSINASIDKLLEVTEVTIDEKDTLLQVRQYCSKCPQAQQTLENISRNYSNLSCSRNMTLQKVLALVWNRINNKENETRREDLIKSLISALADASDKGNTVCATGIASRIVSSLECIDVNPELVNVRPVWAIRQEMLTKAQKIKEQMDSNASNEVKDLLLREPEGKGEEEIISEHENKVKKEIVDVLSVEYSKILSNTEFNDEVNKWINYLY